MRGKARRRPKPGECSHSKASDKDKSANVPAVKDEEWQKAKDEDKHCGDGVMWGDARSGQS